MKKIAILASGSGSNAQRIAEHFKGSKFAKISLILSNKKDAYVLERAKKLGIPSAVFDRSEFYNTDNIVNLLSEMKIDLVVLAGFLWLVPDNFLKSYAGKIINIHPALLPKYGGKGMFGDHVHNAVVSNHEEWTGITIHYINERYDEGDIIFQSRCEVKPTDTSDDVANKVHALEYEHFSVIIEEVLRKMKE